MNFMNDGQSPNDIVPSPAQPAAAPQAATPQGTTQPQQPVVMQSKMIGKYKVEVINEKCIGAASCVAIAPMVFELTEENIARVISQDGNDDDTKLLAAQSCPTAAIIVTDTSTGQQVWPRVDV
jgi:ferredoxin